jgi:hypothetical protein
VSHDHVFDEVSLHQPCQFLPPPTLHSPVYIECDALQLRVDVPPEPESSPEVRPYAIGTPLNPPSPIKLPHPVKLVPRQRNSYFVPHQSFSIMFILQNPMMLIMVFGGVMMLAMPYIMVRTSLIYYLFLFFLSSLPF